MLVNLVPIGLYFCFLLAVLIFGSRSITNPSLFLFRSLFPSWQFFHGLGRVPRLYYRCKRLHHESSGILTPAEWSDWVLYLPKMRRSLRYLIFNPEVNLKLLEQTLIEQLTRDCMDIQKDSEVSKLVSYRMVDRLVRKILRSQKYEANEFQFRIMSPELGQDLVTEDDLVLQSPNLRLDRE